MLYTAFSEKPPRRTIHYGATSTISNWQENHPGEIVVEGSFPNHILDDNGVPQELPPEPVVITRGQINYEAWRRIESHFPIWKQINLNREDGAAATDMNTYIDAVRDASDQLSAMTPIPLNYAADTWWPLYL